MLTQLQSLQRENADLRQQLAQARGLQSHQPYAPLATHLQPSLPASSAQPQLAPVTTDLEMTSPDSPRSLAGVAGVDAIGSHGFGHGLI